MLSNMESKTEIFDYLKNKSDKSGGFKKEDSIKKNYPDVFEGIEKTQFPENYTFQQKLWHYLQDDFTVHRCRCGNELNFISFKKGYRKYCSRDCSFSVEHNKETISTAQVLSRNSESRKKAVNTIIKKNGGKFWSEENIERIKKPYKDDKERCDKIRESLKRNRPEMNKKISETMKMNMKKFTELSGKPSSGNPSSVELLFYKYLIEVFGFENVEPQYFDGERYSFLCDFHIPKIDMFIDINGTWTHGGHPFNPSKKEDIDKLTVWKSKCNEYYNNAIYTWTNLDVRKREISEKNGLNRIEIFSNNIDECIEKFENNIKDMLVEWCMKNDFPGIEKWPAEHPIWDCNVGKLTSPKKAWKDDKYIRKAVDNLFYILKKDYPDFRKKHIDEFMKCEIHDNRITASTKRLLELILNRFTIAKIAPKVTALSCSTFEKIIEDSGIDISRGVYIPMAGFGGIVKGVELWGKEHGKKIECECYDINQNFCKWYGWEQRDVLESKIKTDKVCIVCPPFGKKYEQWEGTPTEMSEKPFVEWYRLIKEYIDAPEYIIIGPEIDTTGTGSNKGLDTNGKKRHGLFSKKVGVMMWTDDMVNKENGIL